MKRILSALLITILCLTLLIGCQGKGGEATATTGGTTTTGVKPATEAAPAKPPEVTIKWLWKNGTIIMPEDSYVCKKIKEDLNINYVHVTATGNSDEKLQLLIASDDIPDVITTYSEMTTKLMQDGIIIPVDQYLNDQYIPNVIRVSNNWEKALDISKKSDGHIYCIPMTTPPVNIMAETMYIRYDWLDKLKLQVPKTMDELKTVLVAFAKQDPDGNGKADTWGTMLSNKGFNMGLFALQFGASGLYQYEGKVVPGWAHPRYKDFLKYMKSLIDEGAIPRDTLVYDGNYVSQQIQAGKVGMNFEWNDYVSTNEGLQKAGVTGAVWKWMDTPKGIYEYGVNPNGGIIREEHVISKSNKNIEATLRLMNYMANDTSTEGNLDFSGSYWTARYGERGVNWDITPEGYFDNGNFSTKIQEQNKLDSWAKSGTATRFRSKFDDAIYTMVDKESSERFKALMALKRVDNLPDSDPNKPVNTEGLEYDKTVSDLLLDNKLTDEFTAAALLGKVDIDTGFEENVRKNYARGWDKAIDNITKLCKENGRIK